MAKKVSGVFTTLNGKEVYKIENYDCMENFFMTITSSSDIWNFCWSWGGITAGRIDSNHSIFPYYTSDKVSDAGSYTGAYTCVKVEKDGKEFYWEPFASFYYSPVQRKICQKTLVHNIYKNFTGTQVWFEEINTELNILFRTGWTSCEKFGLVRTSYIENLSDEAVKLSVLDGCQNIMPACCTSDFQNEKSNLLDAYKKTDLDEISNIAFFSLSSVVSDKAEPNESLYANTCWFSTDDKIVLGVDGNLIEGNIIKGKRPSCFIERKITLGKGENDSWYQVFDTYLDLPKIESLKNCIKNRNAATKLLEKDIENCETTMNKLLREADGVQNTGNKMTCLHHQQNVMFNIMRGGIFADNGNVDFNDFIKFVGKRNFEFADKWKNLSFEKLKKENNPQFLRLYYEYMPLTFSRRHGDPSRPWNVFNINLKDSDGKQILNYEGNWRDIFQNWEALVYSYPEYVKNMCVKFLNAMTIDGFNPYKINRQGIDWEIPDPNNPWAQIGYWGDHQVIYFEKLLEFYNKTKREELLNCIDEKIYTSSNVPYRIKKYEDILENPRDTIIFDRELSNKLKKMENEKGSDAKLVCDKEGNPELVTFSTKVLQIIIAKLANFVPGGGIWLNTQRPEWNDANNALAGYGLSVVTLCYLYRFTNQLIDIYKSTNLEKVSVSSIVLLSFNEMIEKLAKIKPGVSIKDDILRKTLVDSMQIIFEKERFALYSNGYSDGDLKISCAKIVDSLLIIREHLKVTIESNKKADGLYHSYNTLKISKDKMEVCYLQEMLEGQVAILSSTLLSPQDSINLIQSLRKSRMYEERQNSYMLYPNKELLPFYQKNQIKQEDINDLSDFINRTGNLYLKKDINNVYHFNADFRNVDVLKEFISRQDKNNVPDENELIKLLNLYEKAFNHQSFTGRSGTFYAYEGLGSIYWHMVSKLLLSVQENLLNAYKLKDANAVKKLTELYYEVRSGLGYNKTPELYGAFPADPYSHTPFAQGSKQPGMTGQVKEEIITRWGELGISIENGIVSFEPFFIQKNEIKNDGTLDFTWCGTPVKYYISEKNENKIVINGKERNGNSLTLEESHNLFKRNGMIKCIEVFIHQS